jgi:hypothetical protein
MRALWSGHAGHETRRRGVISLDVGEPNTEAFWTEFVRGGVARDIVGVRLANLDASAASGPAPVPASPQETLARIVRSACSWDSIQTTHAQRRPTALTRPHLGIPFLTGRPTSLCAHAVATRVARKRGSPQVSMLDLEVPAP